MNDKKRHHFVPVSYLKGFCDESGKIRAFFKGSPPNGKIHLKPDEIGFENYYYSQPLPEGGQNNNAMEDAFGKFETGWPELVQRLSIGSVAQEDLLQLLTFVLMLRVRVPAARDMVELSLAECVKATVRALDRAGRLPPPPREFPNLLHELEVSIDPHRSMLAMVDLAKGVAQVLDALSYQILHNGTDDQFLTSDCPVCYFDPLVPESHARPFTVSPPDGAIELIFPISSKLMLRGFTSFGSRDFHHLDVCRSDDVLRLNKVVAKFGYRMVLSSALSHLNIASAYSEISPILKTSVHRSPRGEGLLFEHVFGRRSGKPKWRGAKEQSID
ncbi:DUF4238 domain-containing protein [Bradyrhizobium sp. HKCCYLRH3099]|uniref:DUF4238 domain-containing protein n=1 Tax=unclassified Bradyrhizobium TaxID=2631580 RepID=UPI003EBAF95A